MMGRDQLKLRVRRQCRGRLARRTGLYLVACAYALPFAAIAQDQQRACSEDAMLVFDASRSMAAADAGDAGLRRIDSVRTALTRILPAVAPKRRLGLVTYGPGPHDDCSNVTLELRPQANAGKQIQERVNGLIPDGRTPLTQSVRMAAEALAYRTRPATIVLLTDGEESCKGDPCALARHLKTEGSSLTIHVISYRIDSSLGTDGVFQARCLADETGGIYASASTVDEVAEALKRTLLCPLLSKVDPPLRPVTTELAVSAAATNRSLASER
jgi:Ca-activated chloride channel homolog